MVAAALILVLRVLRVLLRVLIGVLLSILLLVLLVILLVLLMLLMLLWLLVLLMDGGSGDGCKVPKATRLTQLMTGRLVLILVVRVGVVLQVVLVLVLVAAHRMKRRQQRDGGRRSAGRRGGTCQCLRLSGVHLRVYVNAHGSVVFVVHKVEALYVLDEHFIIVIVQAVA